MRKPSPKFIPTAELKEHYKKLGLWLRNNKIEHKKLTIGFQIDIRNIPKELSDEFIEVATFDYKKSQS